MADDTERRVSSLEARTSVIEAKIDQFIGEMRQQNEMRAQEISDLRKKQEADMSSLRNEIQGVGREVRNLFLTAAIGIGAMFATVVYTVIKGGG